MVDEMAPRTSAVDDLLSRLPFKFAGEVDWYFRSHVFAVGKYETTPWVQLADGVSMSPREFFFVWCGNEPDGAPHVFLALRIDDRHGLVSDFVAALPSDARSPLTTTSVRKLNLRRLIAIAGDRAAGRPTKNHKLRPGVLLDAQARRELRTALEGSPAVRRGKRLPDEHLEKVAAIYRAAIAKGSQSPTADVGERFFVARSSAGRWLVEARKRGILDPAQHGIAGEHPKGKKPKGRKR